MPVGQLDLLLDISALTCVYSLFRSTIALSIGFVLNAFFFPCTTASVICTSIMSPILNTYGFTFVYLHAIQ